MAALAALSCGQAQIRQGQMDTLQDLVAKNIQDPALIDLVRSSLVAPTSTERGVQRWEQVHLIAALDVLNAYQRERRARFSYQVVGLRPSQKKQFKRDPRTRVIEILKHWLRAHAACSSVSEDEVRGVCGLCRDILNHPKLFPARNPRSFLQTIAEVYEHLQQQLREVLESERACADLMQKALSLGRNLISDAISYLLLAPTDLKQTDLLPSLEVVSLWQSLPEELHSSNGQRSNPTLQRAMRDAWRTPCGALFVALLQTPCCVRLFDPTSSEASHAPACSSPALAITGPSSFSATPKENSADCAGQFLAVLEEVREMFDQGNFKNSGLAGAFRLAEQQDVRDLYLTAIEATFDVAYLVGEVLVHFHRISSGMGDYGAIRVAPWLHPFLDALIGKVHMLKNVLTRLNDAVEEIYIIARARGQSVPKPAPTSRMCARAHASIERAVTGRGGGHVQAMAQFLEDLKARSAPERLPHVTEGLGDACLALQAALSSPELRARLGDVVPFLPALSNGAVPQPSRPRLSLEGATVIEIMDSEDESSPERQIDHARTAPVSSRSRSTSASTQEDINASRSLPSRPKERSLTPNFGRRDTEAAQLRFGACPSEGSASRSGTRSSTPTSWQTRWAAKASLVAGGAVRASSAAGRRVSRASWGGS
eukprot:TRINITY_DN66952_c0_g1_i1.p1 TRINITY_DN66952_c0_g1~~TRINITY_DN66952_c0_g1_i1.p1  ORF type:complete len:655 (+),score=95.81 TRINITY_DN66952_c0_g1_i1:78-2042(+)